MELEIEIFDIEQEKDQVMDILFCDFSSFSLLLEGALLNILVFCFCN